MCGRRWGKSKSAAYEAIATMMIPQQKIWVVAPTYDKAEIVFGEIYWAFMKSDILRSLVVKASMSKQGMEIQLVNGSICEGKSADNEVSLIGVGLHGLIIDEAPRNKEETWTRALRATLSDHRGWALFIGTPYGLNWFTDLYDMGQRGMVDYESWCFPTVTNPYIDEDEIKDAEMMLPSLIFKQEYLAQPVAAQDMYFSWDLIQSCIDESIPQIEFREHQKHEYYLGLDVARMGQDKSVFIISEKSWHDGKIRIVNIIEVKHNFITQAIGRAKWLDDKFKFNKIYIDETGLGSGVVDGLKEQIGPVVEGITFTIEEKENLYSNLKMHMERQMLKYPKNKKLTSELQDLRYEYTSQGRMKIHHSNGGHDDYADALALSIAFAKQKAIFKPNIY